MNETVVDPALERVRTVDAYLRRFEAAVVKMRDGQVECAKVLEGLSALDAWGCSSSAGHFGERFGVSADETRDLLDFGRAMRALPFVEQQVRRGQIPVASAACVGEAHSDPALLRDGDDWVGWAQTRPTRALRQVLRQRKEEARLEGERAFPLLLYVRRSARDDFKRAREVASQKASRALTPGETFETLLDHYLDAMDPDRVRPGPRRAPHTAMVDGRYVPMAVVREIYERQGRCCAVPFCDNSIFLEKAHVVAHAKGGDREADNLVILCTFHHFLFDTGYMRMEGTAAKPRFLDEKGHDLAKRFEPKPASASSTSRSKPPAVEAKAAAEDPPRPRPGQWSDELDWFEPFDDTPGPAPP